LKAVPNPHAGLKTRKIQARGEVPSLINPPERCPFAPRCPEVMEICKHVMPPVSTVGEGHWTRCHLFPPDESETVKSIAIAAEA